MAAGGGRDDAERAEHWSTAGDSISSLGAGSAGLRPVLPASSSRHDLSRSIPRTTPSGRLPPPTTQSRS